MSDAVAGPSAGGMPFRGAAFFDVDGTIVSTHIVHQYLHVRRVLARQKGAMFRWIVHPIWRAIFVVGCIRYAWLDRVSRTRMNIAFYRSYRGLRADDVRAAAEDCFRSVLKPNMFPAAKACVAEHLSAGRTVVLVTGSIDFLIEPLARHFSEVGGGNGRVELTARTLVERDGVFTGELDGLPIGEGEKARLVKEYAVAQGIDLSVSYGYGDSIADAPMLELVGHAHVVNGDEALTALAVTRGWARQDWRTNRRTE